MNKQIQAKHLPDQIILDYIDNACTAPFISVLLYEIEALFPDTPFKVVLAKVRALVRRKLIDGCDCGCSGQFTLTEKGRLLCSSYSLAGS